jgi:hypothetical protein
MKLLPYADWLQARDQQRLEEQRRCASILREQLAERERQRQWQEELQDQVSKTLTGGCVKDGGRGGSTGN